MARKASNVDLQPRHEWEVKDGCDVILLHVPEYNDHELRVTLENGSLTVTGDRKLEGSKFKTTFRISNKCPRQDIHPRLHNGCLRITLPKNAGIDQTGDQNGCYSSVEGFDKRLAAKVVSAVIIATGVAVGIYLAFRNMSFTMVK